MMVNKRLGMACSQQQPRRIWRERGRARRMCGFVVSSASALPIKHFLRGHDTNEMSLETQAGQSKRFKKGIQKLIDTGN